MMLDFTKCETKEDIMKIFKKAEKKLMKTNKLIKLITVEIDSVPVPSSYEQAHYKMGLERAIEIISGTK